MLIPRSSAEANESTAADSSPARLKLVQSIQRGNLVGFCQSGLVEYRVTEILDARSQGEDDLADMNNFRRSVANCMGPQIFDSDQVHCLEEIPRDLIIVGAGIIGLEYASMFAALGVKVTLLDQRPILLDFVDREIVESLCFQLRQLGTVFRLGEKSSVCRLRPGARPRVCETG